MEHGCDMRMNRRRGAQVQRLTGSLGLSSLFRTVRIPMIQYIEPDRVRCLTGRAVRAVADGLDRSTHRLSGSGL